MLAPPSVPPPSEHPKDYGRDEMNLADFPISVLQRQQPRDGGGRKIDTVFYTASRYDSVARRRVPQRVTLTTSSQYGLPTPADENVVLALLYVAKHANRFSDPTVHFRPHQLFHVMRWAPNSRSYKRVRDVLRRLKALTILYENAWWDPRGGKYHQEFATGIIAEYHIIQEAPGRKRTGETPPSWIRWTPTFFQSLQDGNLKRLDLDQLFALRLPTSQRMYRFLDKRFHASRSFEMDLQEFAYGHIGLTAVANVAIIKQRLAPALAALESIGFIKPADADARFRKVKRGVWRIRFDQATPSDRLPPRTFKPEPNDSAAQIVSQFYELRFLESRHQPQAKELAQARQYLLRYGHDKTTALISLVAERLKEKWPDAKSFAAADRYMQEVAREYDEHRERQRSASKRQAALLQEHAEQVKKESERRHFIDTWKVAWDHLPAQEQEAIRQQVLANNRHLGLAPGLLETKCLYELARRSKKPEGHTPDEGQMAMPSAGNGV